MQNNEKSINGKHSSRRKKRVNMNDLIYLYGLVPKSEIEKVTLPSITGFDGEHELFTSEINDQIVAIVTTLDGEEYTEASIEDKVDNDMEWLQEKAFHHHETISTLNQQYTLIPLKFCTIYKSEDNLRESIQEVNDKVVETFEYLQGKEEWTIKIYCDDDKLRQAMSTNNEQVEAKRKEIEKLPKGRRFFEEKKIDRFIDTELENEKDRLSESLHNQVKTHAIDYKVKKSWSKDVTGLKEDMILNSVYLLAEEEVAQFKKDIEQWENTNNGEALRIDANGPWPAYHFSVFY